MKNAQRNLKPVDAVPGRPLYHTVREAVQAAVDTGRYAPGERLPSTKSLAVQLGVSLVTVHRAMQELVVNGVLRRGQGRGTFVHEEYLERAHKSAGLRFGLVFHGECSVADLYHGQVLEGVRRGAFEVGADLVLLRFGEDWRNECQGFLYVNPFQEQLDRSPWFMGRPGLGSSRGKAEVASRAATDVPIVVVGASWERPGMWTIDTDNHDIARQSVDHLISLGHTRIGYLGATQGLSNSVDRFNGFRAALAIAGIPFDDTLVVRSDGWRCDGDERSQLNELLTSSDRPTAIFAAGYHFALDVYSAARNLKIRIPEDVSVISVDDPPSADHLSPALTTIRQPLMAMGALATRTLMERLNGRAQPSRRTLLKGELVVRGSTSASS